MAESHQEWVSPELYKQRAGQIAKCVVDPVYFARNFFYIETIDEGKVLLDLYPKQEELLRAIHDNRRTISLASRQSGKTTAYTAEVLHICTFMTGKAIAICANKEKNSKEFLRRIREAYKMLPDWLKPEIEGQWSATKVTFKNGCSIHAMSTASDSARSGTYYCLDGSATIDLMIDRERYNNIAIKDAFDLINKKEETRSGYGLGDLSVAIGLCRQASSLE